MSRPVQHFTGSPFRNPQQPTPAGPCAACDAELEPHQAIVCEGCGKAFCREHCHDYSLGKGASRTTFHYCDGCSWQFFAWSLGTIVFGLGILALLLCAPAMVAGLAGAILDARIVPESWLAWAGPNFLCWLGLGVLLLATLVRLVHWLSGTASAQETQLLYYGLIFFVGLAVMGLMTLLGLWRI